ncbi:MAG TPA: recombination protein O N-terminal domain-containing protein [Candidatus Paceibacterota bacterium]|nr:recombination protein O N-terminal domain-containing protein [Candidatus Paceibacterota bacterium]
MQHKYVTRAFVLGRHPAKEAGASIVLLTAELGLVRARAEGVRRSGAKLAHALQTLSEVDATLLRGKEGWRLSGAVLIEPWFSTLPPAARLRAGRRASLILRLVQGESTDASLFSIYAEFLGALRSEDESLQDSAELRATLQSLSALGHDAGAIPTMEAIRALSKDERRKLIARINQSLTSTGL